MDTTDKKGESWYTRLLSAVTGMADQLELSEDKRESFRAFVMELAREQYRVGNKAGIRWLKIQQLKEQASPGAA